MRSALAAVLLVTGLIAPSTVLSQTSPASQAGPTENAYTRDAESLEGLINANYAYLDRFESGRLPISDRLRREAGDVEDADDLLRYAERVVFVLADHHASTGRAFSDSWGLVPTYSDLWIERDPDGRYRITAVRDLSPASRAGVGVGDTLVAVDGVPIDAAVAAFWSDLGVVADGEHLNYAARVLAAGRRDRRRDLTIRPPEGDVRRLDLVNLYQVEPVSRPLVEGRADGDALVVRFNNSLGDPGTVAAFDALMATARPNQPIIIDLTDTPSGGNTTVARGIMGWFVREPRPYQMHNLPSEVRASGVERQWIEQVLPREGRHHDGPVTVRVGRWTGSMGEGLAVGFDALGARVVGDPMAQLRGAIYNYTLDSSGLSISFPAERIMTVNGLPREDYVPGQEGRAD